MVRLRVVKVSQDLAMTLRALDARVGLRLRSWSFLSLPCAQG